MSAKTKKRAAATHNEANGTARPSSSAQTAGGADSSASIGIEIAGIALRHLEFKESLLAGVNYNTASSAERVEIDLEAKGHVKLFGGGVVELVLDVTVKPDARLKPYEVRVSIGVQFKRQAHVNDQQVMHFVNTMGPIILYPYVREMVSNVTTRSAFGALHLDPLRVAVFQQAAAAGEWAKQ